MFNFSSLSMSSLLLLSLHLVSRCVISQFVYEHELPVSHHRNHRLPVDGVVAKELLGYVMRSWGSDQTVCSKGRVGMMVWLHSGARKLGVPSGVE